MATQYNSMTADIISRSDATLLVEFYYYSNYEILETEIEDKDDKETIKNFTQKCHDEGLLADIPSARVKKIIRQLYFAMESLAEYIYFKDIPDISDYDDLGIDLPPGENTMFMLHHAMDNYNYICDKFQGKPVSTEEDLSDCFIEKNICSVCQVFRSGAFYFSTMYGLDLPVCSYCIHASNCDDSEYEDNEDDEDDEDKGQHSKKYKNHCDELAEEPAQECCGCNECKKYSDGWKSGWKAAMHYVNNMFDDNQYIPPPPSKCNNCKLLCPGKPSYSV